MEDNSATVKSPFGEVRYPDRKPGAKKAIWVGVSVISLAFGVLGIWGSTVPLASAVIAQGQVVVAGNRKEIQHRDGGTIGSILVKDGDLVKKGQILIELDDADAKLRYTLNRIAYFSTLATIERLTAEKAEKPALKFTAALLQKAASDPSIQQIIDNEHSLFQARYTEKIGQVIVLRQKIVQLQEEIYGYEAEQNAATRQLMIASDELNVLRKLLREGYTTQSRVSGLEREIAQLKGSMGKLMSNIARVGANISETQLKILQLTKQTRSEINDDMQVVQEKSFDLREKYMSASKRVENLRIRAPQNGLVVKMQAHTVGGVLVAGETVLEIVPNEGRLIIEAHVKPQDIDHIKLGQDTTIRVTAFNQRTTPLFAGNVSLRSADTLQDSRSGEQYYLIRVVVKTESRTAKFLPRLKPGMPAELMINTGERTALAYIVQPIYESMNRAMREQ